MLSGLLLLLLGLLDLLVLVLLQLLALLLELSLVAQIQLVALVDVVVDLVLEALDLLLAHHKHARLVIPRLVGNGPAPGDWDLALLALHALR